MAHCQSQEKQYYERCACCGVGLVFNFRPRRAKCCERCSPSFDPGEAALKARRNIPSLGDDGNGATLVVRPKHLREEMAEALKKPKVIPVEVLEDAQVSEISGPGVVDDMDDAE